MRGLLWVVWAILAALLAWSAVDRKAPAIEHDILTRSAEAIGKVSPDAEVLAYGRFVTVRGAVPDNNTKIATLAAAESVYGALGPIDGLWVQAARPADYVMVEKSADGTLRLTGAVSAEAKAAAAAAARAMSSGPVDDKIVVSGNAQGPALPPIDNALKALAGLDSGTLLVTAERTTLSGATNNTDAANTASALAGRDVAVFVKGPPPPVAAQSSAAGSLEPVIARFAAVKTPDGAVIASGDVPTEAARTELIDALKAGDPSRRVADRLAVRREGLPDDWLRRIQAGAKALAELDWGTLSLDGGKSYLEGMAQPGRIGSIGDGLGEAFTTELTPRPVDRNAARIGELESLLASGGKQLDAAADRAKDLEAQAAKNIADLDAAQAEIAAMKKTGDATKAELETTRTKAESDLATGEKAKADLASANAKAKSDLAAAEKRIAELTAQLAAVPAPQAPPSTEAAMPAAAPPAQPVDPASPTGPQNAVVAGCNTAVAGLLAQASITFESGEAVITRDGNDLLDRLVKAASPCIGDPKLQVTVGGHTDSRGQDRDNLKLSQERANAVKEALIVRSIPPDAITAIGYGEAEPIADNNTDEGRLRNRRITIDWSLR